VDSFQYEPNLPLPGDPVDPDNEDIAQDAAGENAGSVVGDLSVSRTTHISPCQPRYPGLAGVLEL